MTDTINKREHYNLYYIFKEDKEKNSLSRQNAEKLWLAIIDKMNLSDPSPP